ncbi:NAD(P)/FAD-dependent oxidoreductase [Spiroplasma citri]|uniref:Ferredoxin--NADP reductase n=1 Tax=Spiroplasma citri TaxID=2133 RepID=Q14NQ7_SPICI|nr:NAD(P)/FAD-dependent oxidoreductase [Spiroplasma citri]APE75151.1 thioredoxin reductase [Spiroplasma citri]QED25074.1 NAD(P)/FAD-dependent oxidoreductase [Spiroplasma citri]QIA67407.1 SidA/IucD/PvdA family monooxygenase [Spiroplasma citri]QIA69260.1 SidA/IucD/PvdA family monooxygenase [Spiroplasma citri]QIA71127.1 FAD-dependent oxidoreductase [Spiroplasma citri]
MKDILIIGAGPVGLYAWSCAGMLGLSGYIIEGNDTPGGQPWELYPEKPLYDMPGFEEIKTKTFIENLIKQAEKNTGKITYIGKTNISNVLETTDGFTITLITNETLTVKTILITSGNGVFTPIRLEHLDPHQEYENLWYAVKNPTLLTHKKIVILGGGDSAVDWANHLIEDNISKDVTIIHRRSLYRAKESNVQKLQQNKVTELKPYHVKAVDTINNKITALTLVHETTHATLTIPADHFIVQYGAKVAPTMLQQLTLTATPMRKIIIEPTGQTNHPHIFAAGNTAYYAGKYYNMVTGFGEAINALYNITKIIHGQKYHPGYLSDIKK